MRQFIDWVDRRTGVGGFARWWLFEAIPGGARWRHVWGSTLFFAFFCQVITGLCLLSAYSASSQTSWESVFYLQYEMRGGWLLRGIHSVMAQLFVVLLAVHIMQAVIHRAYLAPREVNWWLLLLLAPLAIGSSVTGWFLPQDQAGFWAARVPLNILGITPLAGPILQKLAIGGADIGHQTITRFLAMHGAVLPVATGLALAAYLYLTRRHGFPAGPGPEGRPQPYWPDQALKDAVACLAVMATAVFIVTRPVLLGGEAIGGVELGAPADPSEPFSAARPEWFMLFLYQFLKCFPGGTEVWGAIVVPTCIATVLASMPWIGRWRYGQRLNIVFLLALLGGASLMTWLAIRQDRADPLYQLARREARVEGGRARALAGLPAAIPAEGALSLLRNDPLTQGPKLFARHCAGCHRFDGADARGGTPKDPPTASDLKGFASRPWLSGLLNPDRIATSHYFGATRLVEGKMVRFVRTDVARFNAEQRRELARVTAALSAEATLPGQREMDHRDAALIAEGRLLLASAGMRCTECHQFHKPDEDAIAPDLTGYGSREWLMRFIGNPAHPGFYGKRNDRMPAFGEDHVLDARAIGLLADWLRGDWPSQDGRQEAFAAPTRPVPE